MAKLKGITVTLNKQQTGTDPLDNPIYKDNEVSVNNVL